MISLELGELVHLGLAQLGFFLLLVVIAISLVIRAFRGLIRIQELHISALSQRLETEVGEMRKMVESLKARVVSLEWYIVNNDLPVPHSDEQARELIAQRVREQAQVRALAIPAHDNMAELRAESRAMRERPSQRLADEIREEARSDKRTI